MKYTFKDYSDITFSGYEYSLPTPIIDGINKLIIELGINVLDQKHLGEDSESKFKKNSPSFNVVNNKKNRGNKRDNLDDSWKSAIPFKTTVIEKKEGIEKKINEIRACLNKISNKNYQLQRDTLFKLINDISNNDTEELNIVSNILFEIASTNKFYSELYANLYKELCEEFASFKLNIITAISEYKDSINLIELVDSNIDYDKYCDNNKKNDKRKAITAFIVNLMKIGIISKAELINITIELLNKITTYIDINNKLVDVEEITENIFIIVTLSTTDLKMEDNWEEILKNVTICSQYKTKEHLSISSRAVFKFMDMLDHIKKV